MAFLTRHYASLLYKIQDLTNKGGCKPLASYYCKSPTNSFDSKNTLIDKKNRSS